MEIRGGTANNICMERTGRWRDLLSSALFLF